MAERRVSILRRSAGFAVTAALWTVTCAGVCRGADWQTEIVDQSATGKFSSLRVDRDGNVHVAYVLDDDSNALKYAFWDHSLKHWFTMAVARQSGPCALTLDSKQYPHISFVDFGTMSGSKLKYAHWDGARWTIETIPLDSDTIAYYNSIVLDSNDNPTLSFYEYVGRRDSNLRIRLRTVMWDAAMKRWVVRTVDGEEGSGKFNAMAVDAQSRIHLAYANVGAGGAGLRYALWDGKTWSLTPIDGFAQNNGESVGFSANVALDRDGNPHIAYINESRPQLRYAALKNGQWSVQTVTSLSGFGYPDRNAIALDDEGRPYIGFYDRGQAALKIAHLEGAKWIVEVVDSNGAGFTSSLQIHDGMIWISYADERLGALKVAKKVIQAAGASRATQALSAEKRLR